MSIQYFNSVQQIKEHLTNKPEQTVYWSNFGYVVTLDKHQPEHTNQYVTGLLVEFTANNYMTGLSESEVTQCFVRG